MKPAITQLHKKPDHITALVGAVLTILCAFDVPTKLGITAEQLGLVVGALGTIAGTIRAMVVARNQKNAETTPPIVPPTV